MFNVEDFIQKSLQTQVQTQLFHWGVSWGDAHTALSEYYSILQTLTDDIVEILQVKLPEGVQPVSITTKSIFYPNESDTLKISNYFRTWITILDTIMTMVEEPLDEDIRHILLELKNHTWKLIYKLEKLR